MRLDRGREAAIDRHLPQHGAEFLLRQAVAQRAAEMQFELMHAAEARDHAHVQQAAVTRLEIVVAPHRAPSELVEQVLKLAVEIGGVADGAVDILVTQHAAAGRHPLVVKSLVHSRCPPWPPASWQSAGKGVHVASARPRAWLSTAPSSLAPRVAKSQKIRYLEAPRPG